MAAWASSPAPSGAAQRMVSVVSTDRRTGKLVRNVVMTTRREATGQAARPAPAVRATPASAAGKSAPVMSPAAIADAVERAALEHSLPPQLIHSVIKVESNYDPAAVSPKGALGLMQLIPATAHRFGVSDVFDPAANIEGGARYLRYLLDLYGNDYPLALAAYNAGEGAVAKYGTVPPYPETQNYLKLVARQLREAPPAAAQQTQAAKPAPTVAQAEETTHVRAIVGDDGSLRYVSQ